MFQLGLIGLGGWGRRLIGAVQGKSTQVRFAAAATRSPAKAAEFARDMDVRLLGDIEELLADASIDAVVVVSPAPRHAEHGLAAVVAGKPVMVIKPLATSRADAAALFGAARDGGVLVALGYDRCFTPAVAALREKVRSGALGRIIHAEADFCVDRLLELTGPDTKTDPANYPPGSLADHMLYTMIELIGPVATVKASGFRQVVRYDFTDTACVELRFVSGATGHLTAIGVTPNFHRLHFFGEKGWAEVRGNSGFEYRLLDGDGGRVELDGVDACRVQLEAFADACQGRRDWPVPPDDALNGVAARDAMRESAASGAAVTLD